MNTGADLCGVREITERHYPGMPEHKQLWVVTNMMVEKVDTKKSQPASP